MNLLAHFDPGDAMTGLVLIILLQTTVIILLAALWSGTLLRLRSEARHTLWLGVFLLIPVSPALAVVARNSGLAVWAIVLPVKSEWAGEALEHRRTGHAGSRLDSLRLAVDPSTLSIPAEHEPPAEAVASSSGELARPEMSLAAKPEVVRGGSPLVGGLTLLWAVGVFVGLFRIWFGWARMKALCRSTSVLDPTRYGPTLGRVRDVLGIAGLPPVFTSRVIQGPVVVGLLRPRVILPEGLAESLAIDPLRDVLIHECAHVIRFDAWVGLLQRLAGAFFWPHPLVLYASGQLSRAREEVCDNHVLRCGDRRDYARTLLDLTERYSPLGAVRPGLGLLGARWTLADRVAGLLDTRRIPMTHATFRLKITVWAVLAITGLAVTSVRLDRSARADEPQAKPAEPPGSTAPAVWSVEGTVVDEQGRPVAGARVRAVPDDGVAEGHKTGEDGAFVLPFGGKRLSIRGIVAETDGGARIGLIRFEDGRTPSDKGSVKIVLKPSRPVSVRVNDVAGSPVPGAAVSAMEHSFRSHAITGPDGTVTLRVPADAKVQWLIGHKADVGFDYFENYRIVPAADFPPLPADVTLTLNGAETVRVKAVDSKGQPVSGVEVGLGYLRKKGKLSQAGVGLRVMTDREGFATFDWLPKGGAGTSFQIATSDNFSSPDRPNYERGGPTELIAHVFRNTRLSGAVRFPDRRPAAGLLVRAQGYGPSGGRAFMVARTLADGSYVLDVPSELSYVIAVIDETWAAPSLSNVIVREGQEQGGLNFSLTQGTLLRGQVSEAPDQRPSAGAEVWLIEEGGPVSKEFRQAGFGPARLNRSTTTDALGRYHYRVGPGRYSLQSPNAGGTAPIMVEVKNEAEIVRDFALGGPVRDTYLSGVVIEKTPTGDRPVAGATIFRLRVGSDGNYNSSRADDQGRFRMLKAPGEWILRAASGGLAGLMPLSPESENVTLVVSKAPTITGRVIDSNGTPQAARHVTWRIDTGPRFGTAGHFGSLTKTDDQGRFSLKIAPVGSQGELSVFHDKNPTSTTPRTVVRFEVPDPEPIVIPDLVIPAEKMAK
jgi:beta-lactamase regulating signal transducer with metallopeptidase domain